jgi:hypothetical protein
MKTTLSVLLAWCRRCRNAFAVTCDRPGRLNPTTLWRTRSSRLCRGERSHGLQIKIVHAGGQTTPASHGHSVGDGMVHFDTGAGAIQPSRR